jgi:hypothetical protein
LISSPLSTALNVQLGEPKLQVVALTALGETAAAPTLTLPTLVSCMRMSTELLPEGIENAVPSGQFTVMPLPVAERVPLTPPV